MAISKIGSKALVDCSVAAVDIEDNSITSAKLAGSIANAKLANSSITVNGTSVSLGASGSIPAVSWQSVVTADGSTTTSAVAGNGYFIDTTSNAHTINLPGSPSAGDTIAIKDYAGTFGTNNLTIERNGNNIQGVANDSLISTNRASIILVYSDATKGWLYTVESNVADLEKPTFITATGGTVTESGDFKIHTFTGDGTFTVCSVGNSAVSNTVDYLVVAGGGGAGGFFGGAAGGGGFRYYANTTNNPQTCAPASPINNFPSGTAVTVTATAFPITVGGGGSTNPLSPGNQGSSSTFSTITSAGGGFGGGGPGGTTAGGNGGSGGGSGGPAPTCSFASAGTGNTPPVSPPQGTNGGQGKGGAGGGALVAAGGPGPAAGGAGAGVTGFGTAGENCGSFYYFSGGGGGGCGGSIPLARPGGLGGGGDNFYVGCVTSPGTANTGGGGGGDGGSGGKGIVIIRYKYQ